MKIYQVDAFTDRIFTGNPAGVCLIDSSIDEQLMQNIATEMNLSETAFLRPCGNGFDLRWFTPLKEVDLCGHATLASAHILWESGIIENNCTAKFNTKSGLLSAERRGNYIELNFPKEEEQECSAPDELARALCTGFKYVGRNRMDYLVEVASEKAVRNLQPNFEVLKRIETRGVIVTASSDSLEYDFVSRFFAPAYGINEDPVTGSAHCCLGPYWKKKLNKNDFFARQVSVRGGFLKVRVDEHRVLLSGKAVTVFCADLIV